jgi:hypothetical protein
MGNLLLEEYGCGYVCLLNFINKSGICYIPENATSDSDCYDYEALYQIVVEWCNDNPEYCKEHETTPLDILNWMFVEIEGVFPQTWLDCLIY